MIEQKENKMYFSNLELGIFPLYSISMEDAFLNRTAATPTFALASIIVAELWHRDEFSD